MGSRHPTCPNLAQRSTWVPASPHSAPLPIQANLANQAGVIMATDSQVNSKK
jgi:hypothetical protein